MEPVLRGFVEKMIDGMTSPERIAPLLEFLEKLGPVVSFTDDTAFGLVVGALMTRFIFEVDLLYHRKSTDAEKEEFIKIILERAPEIKRACMI